MLMILSHTSIQVSHHSSFLSMIIGVLFLSSAHYIAALMKCCMVECLEHCMVECLEHNAHVVLILCRSISG